MNTNESEFEAKLRALAPAAPSLQLAERIAAELREEQSIALAAPSARSALAPVPAAGALQPQRESSPWIALLRRLLWAGAGAAAAVMVLSTRQAPSPVPAPAPAPSVVEVQPTAPLESGTAHESSELIAAADEGLLISTDTSEPQRQMRLTYLERHVWTNPQTGAVIEFEVPREDIVLMPVAMQ